jgi:Bbp16-like protein
MILDVQNQFSDSQAVSASAVGTNVIDLSTARSIGNGEPMCVLFNVEVAADQTTGDEDYTFEVEYASNAAQTTGRQLIGRRVFESGTPTAPAQDADLLVPGYKFMIPLPATLPSEDEQFIGIRYVTAGTTPTITVSAHLVPMSMAEVGPVAYPDALTIS